MKYWLDITNTPQVHFLLAIKKLISTFDSSASFVMTSREFSETNKLLGSSKEVEQYISVGSHYGSSYIRKAFGLLYQTNSIHKLKIDYDICLSCGSERAIWNAYFEHKKSIAFGDNDQARQWTHGFFADYGFYPICIPIEKLKRQGYKGNKLFQYNGFKEDIYISQYSPDNGFLDKIPFADYIVVRPENIQANYIRKNNIQSIVPELLNKLSKAGYNIIYLPRYTTDKAYADGISNVFIPESPLNGLDVCYYANAVLTGAGTIAREAACLGTPAFSFYAGANLLTVDKQMIIDGKMFFSRDVDELISRVKFSRKSSPDLERCKFVANEVSQKLEKIMIYD